MFNSPSSDSRIRNAQNLIKQDKAHGYYIMAMYFRYGWAGVHVDYNHALSMYEKAADKGHAGACYELARLYIQGNALMGVEKNSEKAAQYANKELDRNNIGNIDGYSQADYTEQLEGLKRVISSIPQMQGIKV